MVSSEWLPLETSRHQDHVIAHVRGATALGYAEFDQAVHILLDIGFFWTVYIDGEMALVLQSLAIREFELDEDVRAALSADVQSLHDGLGDNERLSRMSLLPVGALIKEVEIYASQEGRIILVKCEKTDLAIQSSLLTGEIHITPAFA